MADQASTWKHFPQPGQELSTDRGPYMLLQTPPEGGGLGVAESGGGGSWSWCLHPHRLSYVTAAGKVLAPRTNTTFCYLMSSHRALENPSVAGRI